MIDTILCAQEKMVMERKRSWEIYGFDIMIDYNYHPWLIEVNSSPACDYSSAVTESFVKKALPDTLKVILDGVHEGGETETHPIDTGGWDCIFNGEIIPKVAVGFGVDMPLKGERMSMKRQTKRGQRKFSRQHDTKMKDDLVFDDSDLSDYDEQAKRKKLNQSVSKLSHQRNPLDFNNKENHTTSIHYSLQNRRIKSNVDKIIVPLKKLTLDL